MATKPPSPSPLSGFQAMLASQPLAASPRGGIESGFSGETSGGAPTVPQESDPSIDQFAGLGPLLEDTPADVYQQVHGLVLRQEPIALNHLAQDTHWSYVVSGYPWSTLEKEPNRDVYKHSLPYGSSAISTQAVPNKAWDLLLKTTEALLVDFPIAEVEPADDSEEAEAAVDLANRFLELDAGPKGTNDAELFAERLMRSLFASTSYIECWTDPTGGGYVPHQINAHPQAIDPSNPLVDPDGMPTQDYVLRYVTPDGQFTDDPTQAAPEWQPKLRASRWQREHIRVFPETATVDDAEKLIIIGHCTIGEARNRWPTVAAMTPDQINRLTSWTPPRHLSLLPPFQRARWKQTDGREKERQGSSDERTLFYYHIFAKPSADYIKGADVVISGADGGMIIDRRLLSKPVEVQKGQEKVTEIRCLDIPVIQLTPAHDPFDFDPTGRSFIELFAGAVENNAHLGLSFSEIIDQILHTPYATPSTSPISGDDMANARATGDHLIITTPADVPQQLTPPALPTAFFEMYELADDAINSMASQNRPAQGSDKQQEVSGKARQIAISQNNVSLTGKQTKLSNAYTRWCTVKIQRAMSDFGTTQQIRYIGEDGSYKQSEWTGVDFALVGKVTIKAGTGTLLPPDQKVQYLGNLRGAGLLSPDEAVDAARPIYASRLGLQANAHEQYVERAIDAWMKGPPQGDPNTPGSDWLTQQTQYQAALAQYQQSIVPLQAQAQQQSALAQQVGAPPPAPPMLPPPPPAPWNPFAPRVIDSEPAVAAIWMRKLSRVIAEVKYSTFPAPWRSLVDTKYTESRQAVALATAAVQQASHPQQNGGSPGNPSSPSDEQQGHQGNVSPQPQPQRGVAA